MDKPFVLLADDNEATCTLVAALLHHEFVVEIATDGREAIERLKNRHYSAILLDLIMPEESVHFERLAHYRAHVVRADTGSGRKSKVNSTSRRI